jgi:hypothetical protein
MMRRSPLWIAVCAALVSAMVPATAGASLVPALLLAPTLPIGSYKLPPTSLAKPPIVSHADAVPPIPEAVAGSVAVNEPPLPLLPVPLADGSGAGSTHVVDTSSSSAADMATRLFDGRNGVSFGSFQDGDMIVVLSPSSLTGHAGLFDRRYYTSIYAFAVWSANVTPVNGVQREQCLKFRAYDRAYGLWVPSESNHRVAARDFASRQVGKPYNILGAKTDLRSFYCSKLAWASWRYTAGVDLDADRGYWVWPVDLVNSPLTRVFGYWS